MGLVKVSINEKIIAYIECDKVKKAGKENWEIYKNNELISTVDDSCFCEYDPCDSFEIQTVWQIN
jgi:hypothetical protein